MGIGPWFSAWSFSVRGLDLVIQPAAAPMVAFVLLAVLGLDFLLRSRSLAAIAKKYNAKLFRLRLEEISYRKGFMIAGVFLILAGVGGALFRLLLS